MSIATSAILAFAPAGGDGPSNPILLFLPYILIFAVFYFLLIAPARKKQKRHAEMIGNLKNGGKYEGFWAGLKDDNTLWMGPRNGITFGRWDDNNPQILGPKLAVSRYYVIAGRMGAGTGRVSIELFVDGTSPVASKPYPVNPDGNPSKMAIGQERDATNHPGHESVAGRI